jgi:hypothetical protein
MNEQALNYLSQMQKEIWAETPIDAARLWLITAKMMMVCMPVENTTHLYNLCLGYAADAYARH